MLNKIDVFDKQMHKFGQKILFCYMCRFYKVYLYKLVVILPLHDVINKQKLIDLVCKISRSAIIQLWKKGHFAKNYLKPSKN